MIGRRAFLQATVLGVLAPLRGSGESRAADLPRIGVLGDAPLPWLLHPAAALVEYRWAEGDLDRLPVLAAELATRTHVLVAIGRRAAEAVRRASLRVPAVFVVSGDPVSQGLVGTLDERRGVMTGVTVVPESYLVSERVRLLHRVLEERVNIGVIARAENPAHARAVAITEAVAASVGLGVRPVEADEGVQPAAAFAALLSAGVGGIVVLPDPTFARRAAAFAALAADVRVPVMYGGRAFVDAGGLMSYHAELGAVYQRVTEIVARILSGTAPGQIPVEAAAPPQLVVNLRAASALRMPRALTSAADTIVG